MVGGLVRESLQNPLKIQVERNYTNLPMKKMHIPRPMVGWSLRIVGGEDSDWLGRPTSRTNQEEVFFFEVFHSIYDVNIHSVFFVIIICLIYICCTHIY